MPPIAAFRPSPLEARLSLRITRRSWSELQQLAAEHEAAPGSVARALLEKALDQQLNPSDA